MVISEILAELTAKTKDSELGSFPKYQDVYRNAVQNAGKNSPFIIYPDKSRSFSDMIYAFGMITSDDSPLLLMLSSFLFKRQVGGINVYFDDGLRTYPHTHNYAEFGYVAEGQFYTHIENRDYIFNKGDIFLIGKNTTHSENLYRRNSIVLFFSVANNFFDKTMHHDIYDSETEKFIKNIVIGKGFSFVRFAPGKKNSQVPDLFEKILLEMWRPHPGTMHLIIGYMEWILSLLPVEYEVAVQQNDRSTVGDFLFREVRRHLENDYQSITLNSLIKLYGHNMNYFNRLIKSKTGMTFSAFVQNIKLEKAEFLLRTTDFPIEELAKQVGYENLSYFYRIFRKKYGLTPHNLRKQNLTIGPSKPVGDQTRVF